MEMEAEKYKASWVRQKKRVAELEQSQHTSTHRGNRTILGADAATDRKRANFTTWNLTDTELRKVTPSISNEDHNPMTTIGKESVSPAAKISGIKRKAPHTPNDAVVGEGRDLLDKAWESIVVYSGRQRLAKHLLNREEMGCYSLPRGGYAKLPNEREEEGTISRSSDSIGKATGQGLLLEKETIQFGKRILAEARDQESVCPCMSATVFLLLERFNSLFQRREENNSNHGKNNEDLSLSNNKIQHQSMGFRGGTAVPHRVLFTSVSWKAVRYLLHILCEILLLSGSARHDLRHWFYQSHQLAWTGRDDRSNSSNPRVGVKSVVCPRIKGLRAIHGCTSDSRKVDVWDPMTMLLPCNTFFRLLFGLMRGNVTFSHDSTAEESLKFESDEALVEIIQLHAIDLVLALLSDAALYDLGDHESVEGPEAKGEFLSLLVESLFSSHSANDTVKGKEAHSFEFLSSWENIESTPHSVLGNGRRHSTRLFKDKCDNVIQQNKQGVGKHRGSLATNGNNKSEISSICDTKEQERVQLSILVKSRILQLLSHFMLSSSSVNQTMYNISDGKYRTPPCSLAKRILAAVLDYIEENIVPSLSSRAVSDFHVQDAHLQLCSICIQFLSTMSTSDEGFHMVSVQMRLESKEGDPSRWSKSAIGCVASVLDRTLSFAIEIDRREITVLKSQSSPVPTSISLLLTTVVEQCILFFKTVQHKCTSKVATFSVLIAEHRTMYLSCCQRILSCQSSRSGVEASSLLHVSETLRQHVQYLFEELVMEEEEKDT